MTITKFKSNVWQDKSMAEKYVKATDTKEDISYFLVEQYIGELKKRVGEGARVLDMGCGTGVLSLLLADEGYQVTSVDISKEMMDKLKDKMGSRSIEILVGDVFNLPVPDDSFDAIISRWVLPHFPEWPLAVIEAAHKLRSGGLLFFDICSNDNIELAKSIGELDLNVFGYSNDPDPEKSSIYYAAADIRDLSLAATISGLELVAVQPHGFFRQNAVIAAALGGDNFTTYRTELEEHFKNPGANAFIKWFESVVTPNLPKAMVNGMIVVMRRPAEIAVSKSKERSKFIAHIKSLLGK